MADLPILTAPPLVPDASFDLDVAMIHAVEWLADEIAEDKAD
ncbi:MAG: hypothetical protein WCH83_02805 [Alphaproteobacteria bacterium]